MCATCENITILVKGNCVLILRMKNERLTIVLVLVATYLLHICCIIYFVSIIFECCEICGNTSPEYRRWYHFMDDFYRLPFDNVVSIPADQRFLYIPSFEIDIYVVVRDGLW